MEVSVLSKMSMNPLAVEGKASTITVLMQTSLAASVSMLCHSRSIYT